MTDLRVQKMIDTKTLILTKEQTFWHYAIVLFFLLAPIFTTIKVVTHYVLHMYYSKAPTDFTFGYIWILPATLFYLIQKQRLKFTTINLSVDSVTFRQAVKQTAKELNWNIIQTKKDFVIAYSSNKWGSYSQQITIINTGKQILFNSICDPDSRSTVTSLGRNKVNRITFEQTLKHMAQ